MSVPLCHAQPIHLRNRFPARLDCEYPLPNLSLSLHNLCVDHFRKIKRTPTIRNSDDKDIFEVLNFSEVDAGGAPVEERPFLLRELLPRVLAESGAAGIVPVRWPADFTDGFVGDDTKLGITVANLAANALRHAPGAPVEINVSVAPHAAGHVALLIEVADGGPGVPAEEQEMIFKRFIRGSRASCSNRVIARLSRSSISAASNASR